MILSKVKHICKYWIKKIPFADNFLKFILYKENSNAVSFWISRYLQEANCSVVQIGSNDGKTGDPIYALAIEKSKWSVLLVEPVPYLFEKLTKNYPEEPRFKFENVAINDGTTQTFYTVKKEAAIELEGLPGWYDQLGSFYRNNIIKHLEGRLEPYIDEIEVKGVTLDQLLQKHNILTLDLIHIDTEGYDWKILSQLDLQKFKPAIIIFEHKHLGETERKKAVSFLDEDYQIYHFNGDYLSIRREKIRKKDIKWLENRLINSSDAQVK